jgi:hypothetical protein
MMVLKRDSYRKSDTGEKKTGTNSKKKETAAPPPG